MNKTYNEIYFSSSSDIEKCVKELLAYKEKGALVYGCFNGHKLYSDNITIDSAYKTITGKTKAEFEDYIKSQIAAEEKANQEYKEKIPELLQYWSEQGRNILSEEKYTLWDRIVLIRLNNVFKGEELKYCLNIIDVLKKDDTLDDAKDILFHDKHSIAFISLVCSLVKEFYEKGYIFSEYINKEFVDK